MFIKSLAFTGLLLGSTTALAAGNIEASSIEELPDEGNVAISGFVESVDVDDREFTLRDTYGETIEVESNTNLAVNQGDRVTVTGEVENEFLGMGQQIVAANVSIDRKAQGGASLD